MVLNIFPRRKEPATTEAPAAPAESLPEPSAEVMERLDDVNLNGSAEGEAKKRPTRRGSRGGRGRKRADGTMEPEGEAGEPVAEAAEAPEATEEAPAPRPRRSSRRPAAAAAEAEAAPAAEEAQPEAPKPAPRTRRPAARAAEPAPEPEAEAPAPAAERPAARSGRGGTAAASGQNTDTAAVLKAIEQQGRQIEQLARMQEEMARRGPSAVAAPPARVGVFVDTANIELACDRLRVRFDWSKILAMLTKDRQLVRAIAYAPVHDDPNVSPETQRFAEPFLGKGYKVVTKPLKRFQDGSVKANVDIELALDVIEMLDRLDVVCLVSGDGDFVRLVEVLQGKGVRVEVVAVGTSTASNLRHAADQYIDLQSRIREVRV